MTIRKTADISHLPSPCLTSNLYVFLFWMMSLAMPMVCFAEDNQQQLRTVQQSIATKEKNIKQQQQQHQQLQQQLSKQEQEIARAGLTLHTTKSALTNLQQEITALNSSAQKLELRYQAQQSQLAKQLDYAFRQGQNSPFELLLNGENGHRNDRILAYFTYLNDARQETIQQLEQTTTALADEKQLLLQKQSQQKNLLDQQEQEQTKLETTRNARKKTLQTLEGSLQVEQQKLAELKQNETRLRDKIVEAERKARARAAQEAKQAAKLRQKEQQAKKSGSTYAPTTEERALIARTGGLGKPAAKNSWPVRGRILQHFGDVQQGELRWKGLVIAAAEGSDVKAIADGRVLLADWLQGYGLVVVIEHGKGDMSLYGYNQSALVNLNDQVKAGQAIALVGNSGGQQQPALYFEIRRQGQAVNPQLWLEK